MHSTTLVYLRRGNAYLMLHRTRKKIDENKDKWIGVGGKFMEGESPEDCARREVAEETGLIMKRMSYRGIVTFVSDEWDTQHMHLFTCDAFEGEETPCDEGELAWIDRDALLRLPIWEGDRVFLRLLREDAPFFSLKLAYRGKDLTEAALNGTPLERPFEENAVRAL